MYDVGCRSTTFPVITKSFPPTRLRRQYISQAAQRLQTTMFSSFLWAIFPQPVLIFLRSATARRSGTENPSASRFARRLIFVLSRAPSSVSRYAYRIHPSHTSSAIWRDFAYISTCLRCIYHRKCYGQFPIRTGGRWRQLKTFSACDSILCAYPIQQGHISGTSTRYSKT